MPERPRFLNLFSAVSLSGFAELRKACSVVDSHLGEHLSVDFDSALLKTVHESASAFFPRMRSGELSLQPD